MVTDPRTSRCSRKPRGSLNSVDLVLGSEHVPEPELPWATCDIGPDTAEGERPESSPKARAESSLKSQGDPECSAVGAHGAGTRGNGRRRRDRGDPSNRDEIPIVT